MTVRARREGDSLAIDIEDDGSGMDPSAIRDGIGLSNTRARLLAVYGRDHHFEVSRRDTGGTRVELRVPFRTEPATAVPT